eukprot:Nitzschia sp. Nitz4//scaffold63_size106090//69156//70835//NITZ4_004398-RA/size106090-augustus-gene-0.160-mRNA-1//1//CDS//3329555999//9384//frame0
MTAPCFVVGGDTKQDATSSVWFPQESSTFDLSRTPQVSEDDAIQAKELNDLSVKEREQLIEEVHGIQAIAEEDPTFVEKSIAVLKKEIAKLPSSKRRAFERASFLKPGLDQDEQLYLLFLRGDRFDAVKAAAKLCAHFEHKLELFGEAKLPKKITLDDLDEDDMACFQKGSLIFLGKDRSGRAVDLINPMRMEYKHWKNQVRYTWYNNFSILLRDEETQKNGVIDIMYLVDMHGIPNSLVEYVRDAHHILSGLPVRSCGFHVCYNNKIVRTFLSFLHMVTTKERRMRERLHFGSHLEVAYALCSFGVSMADVPYVDDPEGFERYIDDFLDARRKVEEEERIREQEIENRTGLIAHPLPIDVLCGRGRPYQDFEGNLRVGKIIDEHVPTYIATHARVAKTNIAVKIVQLVKDEGGRFLVRKENGWEVAEEKVARGKISQALRARSLKKIREEGCEPAPITLNNAGEDSVVASQGSKRIRLSPDQFSDNSELTSSNWDDLIVDNGSPMLS